MVGPPTRVAGHMNTPKYLLLSCIDDSRKPRYVPRTAGERHPVSRHPCQVNKSHFQNSKPYQGFILGGSLTPLAPLGNVVKIFYIQRV